MPGLPGTVPRGWEAPRAASEGGGVASSSLRPAHDGGSCRLPADIGDPSEHLGAASQPDRDAIDPRAGKSRPRRRGVDLVVDGGRWEGPLPTRALGGRPEIRNGTATGPRLILALSGSDRRFECRSDARWSLLVRFVDPD